MAVLVDSSVWIDHFRKTDLKLVELLEQHEVILHSAVIGELALGTLRNRKQFLLDLNGLPRCLEASFEETLRLIENHKLHAKGIGWIDAQLIASTLISKAKLYTKDKRLLSCAQALDLNFR